MRGPSWLVGIVRDILCGENIRPDKSHYIRQIHLGQTEIIAALEEFKPRWFGEHGQTILQAGFLDQRICAGAAAMTAATPVALSRATLKMLSSFPSTSRGVSAIPM